MQTENNYERKNIWFDRKKFKVVRDGLTEQNWLFSATCVETLTYCLKHYYSLDWVKTFDDLKNFCFYFPEILKTHLYSEKDKCWIENPFDDNDFCNAMFNLLNKDKNNLARNCVLLLEGICFPNIHKDGQNELLFQSIIINGIELFFSNEWDHMPKPSDGFIDFLRQHINKGDIKNYCTKFIDSKLIFRINTAKSQSRKWIQVKRNDKDVQIKNNFIISCLSPFLDKKFKYPFECEKNGLDFIQSAMNIYEDVYKTFINLTHSKKEDAIYDFFNVFSVHFIKHIIYAYRKDETASIKYKHIIYLIYRFRLILQNDTEHLNQILEHLFMIINVDKDFVLPYKDYCGTLGKIKFDLNAFGTGVVSQLTNEKSLLELKNGKILNYQELLPDELLIKINKYNGKNNIKLDLTEQIAGFVTYDEKRVLYWRGNKMLDFLYKMFKLISKKNAKITSVDDIYLNDVFNLLVNNKFSLFNYITKIERLYGDVIVRVIDLLISEKFEKFIDYHSVKSETDKLFNSDVNNDKFIDTNLVPNLCVKYLYSLMITKFVKAKTQSGELAEVVSILLKKFGSVYDFVQKAKNILKKQNYGYKLKNLWSLFLDCILYVDRENNKDVLSLLISWINKNIDRNKLQTKRILLDFMVTALFLIIIAKGFEYETNIFCKVERQKGCLSDKTFDLLNKVISNDDFSKLIAKIDVSSISDFEKVKLCFEQMKIFKFEDLIYLSDEICNPNMESLDPFFELVKKCAGIREKNNEVTVFELMQETENLAQKKVAKVDRIEKIKSKTKQILDNAQGLEQNYRDTKNSFLNLFETEKEKEIRKATLLLKAVNGISKKVNGAILLVKKFDDEYHLKSDYINTYLDNSYKFFCMVYDPSKKSNLNPRYKRIYRKVLEDLQNSKMIDVSLIAEIITNLNDKKIFNGIQKPENIDLMTVESIVSLLSDNSNKTDAMLFKNNQNEDITPNIIKGFELLKKNLTDYICDQIKKELVDFESFVAMILDVEKIDSKITSTKIGDFFELLYNVLCILYDTKNVEDLKLKYKGISKRVICDSKNSELVLGISQNTETLIKKLNEQGVFDNIIDKPKGIEEKYINLIVLLFSKNSDEKAVLFKNKEGKDITPDIINGVKSFKNKLLQYINLQQSNGNQIITKIEEKQEELQHQEKTSSEEINNKAKDELRSIGDSKNDDANNLQDNNYKIKDSQKNKDISKEKDVVNETQNILSKVNDDKKKIQSTNNPKKGSNEEKIEEKKQNVQRTIDVKAADTLGLIKNALEIDDEEKVEVSNKMTNKKYSFSVSQSKIASLFDYENKDVKNNQSGDGKEEQNEKDNITNQEKKINEKQIFTEQANYNNISHEDNNKIKAQDSENNDRSNLNINSDTNINDLLTKNPHITVKKDIKTSKNKNDNLQHQRNNDKANENEIYIKNNNTEQMKDKPNRQNEIDAKTANASELIKNAFDIHNAKKDENNHEIANRRHSFSTSQNKTESLLDNKSKDFENEPNDNNMETDLSKNNLLSSKENKDENNIKTDDQKEFNEIKTQEFKNDNSYGNNNFSARNSNNINDKNQNDNIKRISTNTLRGQKNNNETTNKPSYRNFFLKKWYIFFYQRKKISISIMTVQIIFLFVGFFCLYWLTVTAAVLFITSLTIFLFGRYFSTESDSKNMTTDISDTKEGYEIDLDNQEPAPNLSHHKTDPNI